MSTLLSADAFNARELASGKVQPRHISALAQLWQERHGLEVDGKLGDETLESIADREFADTPTETPAGYSEPDEQKPDPGHGRFAGPLAKIPGTRPEIYATFGDPGVVAKPNKAWAKANILTVRDLPGIPERWHFQCHRLAEPYIREGLRRAAAASSYRVERAASFVLRHIRQDSARPLSLHSWGIAIDIDSDLNRARTFDRGAAPEPWGDEWKVLWPKGVDRAFVVAMESAGFTWGGVWGRSGGDLAARARRCSFFDPMHFELCVR